MSPQPLGVSLQLADTLHHPIPLGRRRLSSCWTPRPRCRAWRLKFEGSARRCGPTSPPLRHCPFLIVVLLLLAIPHPSVPWLANPSSTPYGPGPGAVRTSQARRALPRGGRGAEGAGRPPSTPAGGAAALSREASRCRSLQGPAGGEMGAGLEAEYVGGRDLEAGLAGGIWPREK